MSVSSSDSQDVSETPPTTTHEDVEIPDKAFKAMIITGNCDFPLEYHFPTESSTQKYENPSTNNNEDSYQSISIEGTPKSFSPESEPEEDYIPRLFMENIKEEESFYEESPEETPTVERTKPTGILWFTLDDIPPSRWRKILHEFRAWIDT